MKNTICNKHELVNVMGVGGAYPLEKIKMGAAGQIGDLLSKCSERAFFPRSSSFFFVVSEKDEEVPVGRGGSCEMSLRGNYLGGL